MTATVPSFVWFVTLAAESVLVIWLAVAVGGASSTRRFQRALNTGAFLVLWLIGASILAGAGVFGGSASGPPRIAPAILLPIAAGLLVLAASSSARSFLARVSPSSLVAMQVVRIIGIAFLVLGARGVLPPHFAWPAGAGDVAIGVTAPWVALALHRRARHATALAVGWNVLGLLDLVVAVGIGALTAESAIQAFHSTPSTDAMTVPPLSTIPTFGVPLFTLLHVASLVTLRRATGSPAAAAAPARVSRLAQRRFASSRSRAA